MKIIVSLLITLSFVFSYSEPSTAADVFTGDTKLACEALLCLSSPYRPGECSPSINRLYSIKHKKWSDTYKARLNFLNLCPTSAEVGNLASLIVNSQNLCDIESLNRNIIQIYRFYYVREKTYDNWQISNEYDITYNYPVCTEKDYNYKPSGWWGWGGEDFVSQCIEVKTIVDKRLPKQCVELFNSEYTDYSGIKYDEALQKFVFIE